MLYATHGSLGLWEEERLRHAHATNWFKYGAPSFAPAQSVSGEIPEARAYIAKCYPYYPPGDPRDPEFELEGPFPKPDPSLVKGDLWEWIAIVGPPKPLHLLFPQPAPHRRERDWDDDR